MWQKLLGLFKDTYSDEPEYVGPSVLKRDARKEELSREQSPPVVESKYQPGQGTLIGYDYLKGIKDEEDIDDNRRFFNLSKLLRGEYEDGKTKETPTESRQNIRRKNS